MIVKVVDNNVEARNNKVQAGIFEKLLGEGTGDDIYEEQLAQTKYSEAELADTKLENNNDMSDTEIPNMNHGLQQGLNIMGISKENGSINNKENFNNNNYKNVSDVEDASSINTNNAQRLCEQKVNLTIGVASHYTANAQKTLLNSPHKTKISLVTIDKKTIVDKMSQTEKKSILDKLSINYAMEDALNIKSQKPFEEMKEWTKPEDPKQDYIEKLEAKDCTKKITCGYFNSMNMLIILIRCTFVSAILVFWSVAASVLEQKFGFTVDQSKYLTFAMILIQTFVGLGTAFIADRYGLRVLLLNLSIFVSFISIFGLYLIPKEFILTARFLMIFVGFGRGIVLSLLSNCIGMVTS